MADQAPASPARILTGGAIASAAFLTIAALALIAAPDRAPSHPVLAGIALFVIALFLVALWLTARDSWWTVAAASLAASAFLAACVWSSAHVQAPPALRTAALFAHLAFLVLGFGAVLVADYHGLLWAIRRCTLAEVVTSTARLHLPIWIGLAGLIVSGTLLRPDLTSPLTQLKLGLVAVLTVNGAQASLLADRMRQHLPADLPPRILAWGAATALISQVGWWGAMVIGFLNSET
ncbi:hypothetical protein [Amycolatopsis silviterrae]|uniref:Copper resistance protein D domain-containing protein n=1 Tax=Amycolatopsis silviterrae TaxID=1656914 RepID=A0ABW5H1N2_9PSEU